MVASVRLEQFDIKFSRYTMYLNSNYKIFSKTVVQCAVRARCEPPGLHHSVRGCHPSCTVALDKYFIAVLTQIFTSNCSSALDHLRWPGSREMLISCKTHYCAGSVLAPVTPRHPCGGFALYTIDTSDTEELQSDTDLGGHSSRHTQ